MKCTICGKEFGAGTHCQHCGVDRVTGLANYNGYNNSGDSSGHNSSNYGASSNTTICFACGEIIPSNSEFCPYCSKQLYETCPKCGNTYSSQFPACNKCGTNREYYYKQQESERKSIQGNIVTSSGYTSSKNRKSDDTFNWMKYLVISSILGTLLSFLVAVLSFAVATNLNLDSFLPVPYTILPLIVLVFVVSKKMRMFD